MPPTQAPGSPRPPPFPGSGWPGRRAGCRTPRRQRPAKGARNCAPSPHRPGRQPETPGWTESPTQRPGAPAQVRRSTRRSQTHNPAEVGRTALQITGAQPRRGQTLAPQESDTQPRRGRTHSPAPRRPEPAPQGPDVPSRSDRSSVPDKRQRHSPSHQPGAPSPQGRSPAGTGNLSPAGRGAALGEARHPPSPRPPPPPRQHEAQPAAGAQRRPRAGFPAAGKAQGAGCKAAQSGHPPRLAPPRPPREGHAPSIHSGLKATHPAHQQVYIRQYLPLPSF
jgi:hypothetical protein